MGKNGSSRAFRSVPAEFCASFNELTLPTTISSNNSRFVPVDDRVGKSNILRARLEESVVPRKCRIGRRRRARSLMSLLCGKAAQLLGWHSDSRLRMGRA